MNRKIIISCCDGCPNRIWSRAEQTIDLGYETAFFCGESCKPLEHTNTIPDWYPLPDDSTHQNSGCGI